MGDDAIRERHGVKSVKNGVSTYEEVLLRECEDTVRVSIGGAAADLTQWQARYLASKLYRIARRLRQREPQP